MKRLNAVLILCLFAVPAGSEIMKREPEVPSRWQFVRTFDLETYYEKLNYHDLGAQSVRLRTRYLDPDVNAFVGMLMGFHHFNQDLRLGNPDSPDTAGLLWNWGVDLGLKRGNHLWELDLMGVLAGSKLGPAFAVVGEHPFWKRFTFYHRTEFNLFVGDAILDADQGFYWDVHGPWQLSLGYRWFTSQHMDRSGPRIGVRFLFQSPKIPFLFPSLG